MSSFPLLFWKKKSKSLKSLKVITLTFSTKKSKTFKMVAFSIDVFRNLKIFLRYLLYHYLLLKKEFKFYIWKNAIFLCACFLLYIKLKKFKKCFLCAYFLLFYTLKNFKTFLKCLLSHYIFWKTDSKILKNEESSLLTLFYKYFKVLNFSICILRN